MRRLFNLDGKLLGYKDGQFLYLHDGTCIGKFELGLIYDKKGVYLGEITASGYLARHRFKTNQQIKPWDHKNGERIKYCSQEVRSHRTSQTQYDIFPVRI